MLSINTEVLIRPRNWATFAWPDPTRPVDAQVLLKLARHYHLIRKVGATRSELHVRDILITTLCRAHFLGVFDVYFCHVGNIRKKSDTCSSDPVA